MGYPDIQEEREYVDLHLNSKVDQFNFYSVKLQSK